MYPSFRTIDCIFVSIRLCVQESVLVIFSARPIFSNIYLLFTSSSAINFLFVSISLCGRESVLTFSVSPAICVSSCQCYLHFLSVRHFQSIGPLGRCFLQVDFSICASVCLFVCLCVCSLLRYGLNVFLPPLPKVGCPKFQRFGILGEK